MASINDAVAPEVIYRKLYLGMLPVSLLAAAPIVVVCVGIWWMAGGDHIIQFSACGLIILANLISVGVASHHTSFRMEMRRSMGDC